MESPEIRYIFHNPNPKEETVRFFVSLLADLLIVYGKTPPDQNKNEKSE